MKRHIFLFLMVLLFLFCVLFGFQREQRLPPEKHEVKVRLVLVDVIVTRDGEFVTDLAKDDFEIYEDDKNMPINSFDLISFGRRESMTLEEKQEKISPVVPRKQLVVIIDGINSWQRNLNKGLSKIVDELVSLAKLGNEAMIVQLSENKGSEVLQTFTTDEVLIKNALLRASASIWYDRSLELLKLWEDVDEEDFFPVQVERYTDRLQPVLEREYFYAEKPRFEQAIGGVLSVANMIKDLPGRKSILLISDGFSDMSQKTLDSVITESEFKEFEIESKARTPELDLRRETGTTRIFDPFNILEKKKILSGEEVLEELIRFANAQNISIYALDPDTFTRYLIPTSAEHQAKDLIVQHVDFRAQKKLERINNLSWLSEDTGGVSLKGATKYERFYITMSTDLNYYYQLSYYPPRTEPDNNYHKIAVKVKSSNVDVRFRKGYTDYTEEEEKKIRLVSAFYNPSLIRDLPFEAEFILVHKDKEKYEPWMNIALPVRKLFMERKVAYGTKNFTVNVWVKEKKRGESAFAGQLIIPFNIDESFMNVIKTTDYLCFHYKGAEIPFKQNEYQAIFALQDDQTNEIGTWESMISLPDFKKEEQGFFINCVLGLLIPSSKKGKQSFSISQKDGCLEYGEIKFFPSIANQFQRLQDASIFLQVFAPQRKMAISPQFKISGKGRLSQYIPGELVAESWNKKSKVWSGIFKLSLKNVIFGDYVLKIEIPVSEETPALVKEVRLVKLRY